MGSWQWFCWLLFDQKTCTREWICQRWLLGFYSHRRSNRREHIKSHVQTDHYGHSSYGGRSRRSREYHTVRNTYKTGDKSILYTRHQHTLSTPSVLHSSLKHHSTDSSYQQHWLTLSSTQTTLTSAVNETKTHLANIGRLIEDMVWEQTTHILLNTHHLTYPSQHTPSIHFLILRPTY